MPDTELQFKLAMEHHQAGRTAEAVRCCQEVVRCEPGFVAAWHFLGFAAHRGGNYAAAIDCFSRAVALLPDNATYHCHLGAALQAVRRYDEAIASFTRALELMPEYVEAHYNLANGLQEMGRLEEAAAHYRRTIQIKPDYAAAHNNLGNTLKANGQFDEALDCLRTALQLRPEHAPTHSNLGNALLSLGRVEEGLAHYERAAEIDPGFAEGRHNRAMTWLQLGDFERGWPEYEWRWKTGKIAPSKVEVPEWDGQPLEQRTILLRSEQGIGDIFQFVRYAALVKQRGGRVILGCVPTLAPLLRTCPGVDQVVSELHEMPALDVQAPLMSLPYRLGTTLQTIPAEVPYLFAADDLLQRWRRKLGAARGVRIGIAWQGNPKPLYDRQRSFRLAEFAPVAELPGVELYSLQRGYGAEQVEEVGERFAVHVFDEPFDSVTGTFMDTAAVIANLDLVITPDTALAHLAGAMGAPVWVALPYAAEWRWMLEREDSPWYPSMRLFRQSRLGDWTDVFQRIAAQLREQFSSRLAAAQREVSAGAGSARQVASRESDGLAVSVEISPAELMDKIAILELQAARLGDPAERRRAELQLQKLVAIRGRLPDSAAMAELFAELKQVHEQLWDVEGRFAQVDSRHSADALLSLIETHRQARKRRAALKRAIDEECVGHEGCVRTGSS